MSIITELHFPQGTVWLLKCCWEPWKALYKKQSVIIVIDFEAGYPLKNKSCRSKKKSLGNKLSFACMLVSWCDRGYCDPHCPTGYCDSIVCNTISKKLKSSCVTLCLKQSCKSRKDKRGRFISCSSCKAAVSSYWRMKLRPTAAWCSSQKVLP